MWKLSRLRYAGMLVLFGLAAHAQEPAVETLAGVDSVYILAEHTSELLAQVGLSDTILAERATDILARARLVLSSHDQWLESAGGVYLYVRADAAAAQGSSTAAYVAVVELRQDVRLIRDDTISALGATTWRSSLLGITPVAALASQVRQSVTRLVQEFAAAHQAANPTTPRR